MSRTASKLSTKELALDRDPSSRFLPWIVAALTLVVVIAVGVTFSLASLSESWGEIGRDRLTIRIAASDTTSADRAEKVMAILNDHDGVAEARTLSRDNVLGLLSPWIGQVNPREAADLPLPIIMDVRLTTPAEERAVREAVLAVEGAVIDSTRGWLQPLSDLASLAGLVAAGLAALSVAVIALVTIFATRAALNAHQATVELLRLLGAEERYIAWRLQNHTMMLALAGAVAGAVPGVVIILLGIGAARLDSGALVADLSPSLTGWLTIGLLPILIGLVAMLTARYTVLEMLRNRW